MSVYDETHLEMNAGPFISLLSGIHSQRLMERTDKKGWRKKKSANMNGLTVSRREQRSEEQVDNK